MTFIVIYKINNHSNGVHARCATQTRAQQKLTTTRSLQTKIMSKNVNNHTTKFYVTVTKRTNHAEEQIKTKANTLLFVFVLFIDNDQTIDILVLSMLKKKSYNYCCIKNHWLQK